MEISELNWKSFFFGVIKNASLEGDFLVPDFLIRKITPISTPLNYLVDQKLYSEIYSLIDNQFSFINRFYQCNDPLSVEENKKITDLMRWLINEFNFWEKDKDHQLHQLTALLSILLYCDREKSFWSLTPCIFSTNDLANLIGSILEKLNSSIIFSPSKQSPIHERESLNDFTIDQKENNLAGMYDFYFRAYSIFLYSKIDLLDQLVNFLMNYEIDILVKRVDQLDNFILLIQISSCLTQKNRLLLASKLHSNFAKFALVLHNFHEQQEALSQNDEDNLTKTFISVQSDEDTWSSWMSVFNRYPIRFPTIQPCLGKALSEASNANLSAYVNSISLSSTNGQSRDLVSGCLKEFYAYSNNNQRKKMWELAHSRWVSWKFGLKEYKEHLFSICYCELDFAVIGYVAECLDKESRDLIYQDTLQQIYSIESNWFASELDLKTKLYELLSSIQPIIIFNSKGLNISNWIISGYYKFDFENESYFQYKFS